MPTILAVGKVYTELSKFVELVQKAGKAGLVDKLKGKGPFTVFAPNDEAFKKVPKEVMDNLEKPGKEKLLKDVLLRHIVDEQAWMAEDIPGGEIDTAGDINITVTKNGDTVSIKNQIGMATVVNANKVISNGVVHIVDKLI